MEKKVLLEKQIAGKWLVTTLQEAIEYVDHDILTNRFHVTPHGGCAVLFNKDTFFLAIKVKSIYWTTSTQILKSSLFTFMIPGANCLIK